MTREEKIVWLKRYAEANGEIDRITEDIQRWYSRAMRVTASYSLAPCGGGGGSKQESAIEAIAKLQAELVGKIEGLETVKAEVEAAIDALGNFRQRQVMRGRYLGGLKWEQVAVNLNIDYRWMMKIHQSALDILTI